MFTVHVVAHTHWDREWYQPMVRFRQRLIALLDEILDDPPEYPESFLLDGQTIVLEDYLSVRPERTAELSASLQRGNVEAGPWYVLADELIPSAEALVRNLLMGRRSLRALRSPWPPVLYCPDSFGHPAALPTLAAGFGLSLIVLWRGLGGRGAPAGDLMRWRAPDGTTALVVHLPPDGYEYGSHLPVDERAAQDRWHRMREELGSRSRLGVLLVQNGADHHARQLRQREAVTALKTAAQKTGDDVRASSLSAFAADLLRRARDATIPDIAGELRDSYGYTWTLQGTFATRAMQKRRNALAERALLREAEPWAALARRSGASSRHALVVAAWKSLLQAHPHDTLCGCSIDAVAAATDLRVDDAMAQARGIRDDAIADLVGYDPAEARASNAPKQPLLVVRNCAPRARGGVALVRVQRFLADVPVGPGSANANSVTSAAPESPVMAGSALQLLRRRKRIVRLESPRHYPDNDLVEEIQAAMWLDAVPAYGTVGIPIQSASQSSATPADAVRVDPATLDNGCLRVTVGADGDVSLEERATGRRLNGLLAIEDRVDRGDLYTPSIREAASIARFKGARVVHGGPLVGSLRLRWHLVDVTATASRARVSATLDVILRLEAGASWLRLQVRGSNWANDHRLRLLVRTDVIPDSVWADAAFGPVRRTPIVVADSDRKAETPPPTAPLHRYVSLFGEGRGISLFSDGLAEYEASPDGRLAVTVVRAVGELSRNDLPERPGHAGWPVATPAAQSHGPFAANLAIMPHGDRSPEVIDAIEGSADDVLLPLRGVTLRDALRASEATHGAELRGAGLAVTAIKDAEEGDAIVARCVNLLEQPVDGSWTFGFPVRSAHLARLDESVLEPLSCAGGTVPFRAPPRGVITIVVR